jgi:hypothetical protein
MKLRECKSCRNHICFASGRVMCNFFRVMDVRVVGNLHADVNNFDVICPKESNL